MPRDVLSMGVVGAFGKMPALGDFFRLRPPPGFVEAWDPWLQARLVDLRETLGEGWRAAYLGAPIWRFTLSPGTAGPAGVMGVLMPSVDRVGRDFPLTLVARVPDGAGAFAAHAAGDATFAALEDIALATLAGDTTVEALASALDAVTVPDSSATKTRGTGPGHLSLVTDGAAAPALLDHVATGWRAPSVWSAVLDAGTRILVSEGLPGPERARALFDLAAPLWQDAPQEAPA